MPVDIYGRPSAGPAELFAGSTIAASIAAYLMDRHAKNKAERLERTNRYYTTLDLMREAGEDPFERYPVELFDTSQYEEFEGIPAQGTPEEMQAQTIARAIWDWEQRNKDAVDTRYNEFLESGKDYLDFYGDRQEAMALTQRQGRDDVLVEEWLEENPDATTAEILEVLGKIGVRGNEAWNRVTGCPPGQVKDENGECVTREARTTDPEPCPDGQQRDPDTGLCMPPEVTEPCPPGQTRDAGTGLCMPESPCGPGEVLNPETEQCEPVNPCDTGFEFINGECVEIGVGPGPGPGDPDACPEGQTRDPATGQCGPATTECGEGQTKDPETGQCVAVDDSCPLGQIKNPLTGDCVPITVTTGGEGLEECGEGYARDLVSGECVPMRERQDLPYTSLSGYNWEPATREDILVGPDVASPIGAQQAASQAPQRQPLDLDRFLDYGATREDIVVSPPSTQIEAESLFAKGGVVEDTDGKGIETLLKNRMSAVDRMLVQRAMMGR